MQCCCVVQGGVLYVKPVQASHVMHKPWFKGGVLGSTTTCKVTIAGQCKHTITGHGPDPIFTEALEFLLGMLLCTSCVWMKIAKNLALRAATGQLWGCMACSRIIYWH